MLGPVAQQIGFACLADSCALTLVTDYRYLQVPVLQYMYELVLDLDLVVRNTLQQLCLCTSMYLLITS